MPAQFSFVGTTCTCIDEIWLSFECCPNVMHFFVFPHHVGICQNGLATKVEKSRKQVKERKNRAKKIRGVKKVGSSSFFSFSIIHVVLYLHGLLSSLEFHALFPSLPTIVHLILIFFFFFGCADQGRRCCERWKKEVMCCPCSLSYLCCLFMLPCRGLFVEF